MRDITEAERDHLEKKLKDYSWSLTVDDEGFISLGGGEEDSHPSCKIHFEALTTPLARWAVVPF